jgi:cation diffusion facilitator CzcD-associated flavoprotein CzcO
MIYVDKCDLLIQATGVLNDWKWPKIPGLHDFKGKLMHSATWDESYDYKVCLVNN